MAEPKWTPGPWHVVDGKEVAAQDGGVAEIVTWHRDHDEIVANAHLIAAAPDLYEACDEALRFLDRGLGDYCAGDGGVEMWMLAIQDKLRDAIRKARGEEVEADG